MAVWCPARRTAATIRIPASEKSFGHRTERNGVSALVFGDPGGKGDGSVVPVNPLGFETRYLAASLAGEQQQPDDGRVCAGLPESRREDRPGFLCRQNPVPRWRCLRRQDAVAGTSRDVSAALGPVEEQPDYRERVPGFARRLSHPVDDPRHLVRRDRVEQLMPERRQEVFAQHPLGFLTGTGFQAVFGILACKEDRQGVFELDGGLVFLAEDALRHKLARFGAGFRKRDRRIAANRTPLP